MPDSRDAPLDEPVVTIGDVVKGPNSTLTLYGREPMAGVQAIDIVNVGLDTYEDLGPVEYHPFEGTFTFDLTGKTIYSELVAQVTYTDGNVAFIPSGITVQSNITGEPYTSTINHYIPGTTSLLDTEFVKSNGKDLYTSTPTALPDGGTSYTYANGSFFRGKDYFGFVDSYDSYGQISQHTEYHRDGTNVTDVLGYGKTVTAIGNDTFNEYANVTKFVIGEGFGPETINGFRVGGINHDTVNLPDTDAGRLGGILAHATSGDLGTTLHLGHGDTLTFSDVGIAALRRNRGDFTFGA